MIEIGGTPIINAGGYGGYAGGFDGGMGGNWIWAFLLFALLGNGGFGGNNTLDKSIFTSQNFNQIDNGIRALQNGLCDSVYAVNNSVKDGFYSTGMNIQGINQNLGNAICTQTYELANLVRNVGDKVSNCCCTVERAIDSVKFESEKNANAIIQSGDRNTQRILDWLSNKELSDKNQKIFEMSQDAQTAKIIAAQKPVAPVPAYLQPNPYAPFNPCTGF